MDNRKRIPIIVANWKMNNNWNTAKALANHIILECGKQKDVLIALCPPFTEIAHLRDCIKETEIRIGAQNIHPAEYGPYTGEISAKMLRYYFVSYVIIGHSERRALFRETHSFINAKVRTVLANNMRPILCVGETLEQRGKGKTLVVIKEQISEELVGIDPESAKKIIIAYEPIWAIGTGNTATPKIVQDVHMEIRQLLADLFTMKISQRISIIYGGSMNPDNAPALIAQPDIDGGLVGGAALDANLFIKIIKSAMHCILAK